MCAILFTNDQKIAKSKFLSALGLMEHRGPDAPAGYFQKGPFQLGHNRLKILDLNDRSNQPFFSHDGRWVIIFNGEIYNYQELAKKYDLSLRTTSDTEVLLELYLCLGPKMLDELNGMFAFVVADFATQDFFMARDRLGVKPLYFIEGDGTITAASEIAPLLGFLKDASFDPRGVRQYLKLRTFFGGCTLYKNVKMFPAGHYMTGGRMKCWWQLPKVHQEPPDDEELRVLLRSAVAYRCLSDVPVGSYLSGGLDSTIVTGLAAQPHTWTVGFKDDNEFAWGRLAAEKFKSIHFEVLITKDEFVPLARDMIQKRREPLSVPNEVLLYTMTRAVKKNNTVVLSGEGADELFFGYDRIFRWAAQNPWDLRQFSELYSYGSRDDLEIVEEAVGPFLQYGKAIDIVAAFFQTAHLHGLLRRLDNATMMASVEARVPFCDYRLVERMAGVSMDYRMADGVVKAPLKRIFRDIVPSEIIGREKIGFPVELKTIDFGPSRAATPMDKWFNFNLEQLGVPL